MLCVLSASSCMLGPLSSSLLSSGRSSMAVSASSFPFTECVCESLHAFFFVFFLLFCSVSFLSSSFWLDTFMSALCLAGSAVPLFWTAEPGNCSSTEPIRQSTKRFILRSVFVLLAGCASYFASEFLGRALDLSYAVFSSSTTLAFKFGCHSLISGLVLAMSMVVLRKLDLA